MCIHIYLSFSSFKLKYILSFCKTKITLGEDVSNGMQMGILLCFCVVFAHFSPCYLQNMKMPELAQHISLTSCHHTQARAGFLIAWCVRYIVMDFLKICKTCVHYPNHRIFSAFEGKIKKKTTFKAIPFSINEPLPSINLSLFYHRFSLLQKSRVIALNQERMYKNIIHFKYKLFPIIGIGQKHL